MGAQKNVLEYLEASARQYPDKTAFADETRAVTFAGFLRNAQKIGTALCPVTGGTNKPVAVLVDRRVSSLEMCMGALFSGNFYVPIDNAMPRQRIEAVLTQLAPAAIVFDRADQALAMEWEGRWPLLSADLDSLPQPDLPLLESRRERVLDVDPVYTIFTSGSTGAPKGIVISHRGVIDLIDWMAECFGFSENDIFGNQTPFYFDGSVKDIYLTLKCGATAHILPKKLFSFPVLLMREINEKQMTALLWATSAFQLTANSGILQKLPPKSVKTVAAGGETMLAKTLNIWRSALPEARFINLYGPTEVTVDCTYYIVDREFQDYEAVPIGRPCGNTEILLLGDDLRPVPDGTPGELCVRSAGLAKGYFGEAEKTRAAFIQDPRNDRYPDLIYRTGDLAVKNPEGLLVFQSRRDGQIKHMGYRIELGEVERAVGSFPPIGECVCLYDKAADHIVCLYDGEAQPLEILRYLRNILPKYMCPNVLRRQTLPHNANGKLDRSRIQEAYLHGSPNSDQ